MKVAFSITTIFLLAACKAPFYHFVSPSLNNTAYSRAGVGHVGLQFGTIGIGAKGGIALTDNISLNGFLGALPEANDDYTSRESELSVGFQATAKNNVVTTFYAGTGIGNNEKDKIGLDGDYTRPFVQIQRSGYDKKLFSGKIYVDGTYGARLNYLIYRGVKDGARFNNDVFYTEPYLALAIGARNVRLEILQGLAIKTSGTWRKDLRIFPYFGNIGLLVKLRK